jgi:hypothetical protein
MGAGLGLAAAIALRQIGPGGLREIGGALRAGPSVAATGEPAPMPPA